MNLQTIAQTQAPSISPKGAFLVSVDESLLSSFVSYVDGSQATIKTYYKALRVFFGYVKDKGIVQPSRGDLLAYRDYLESYCKPTTTTLYINALKQFYKWVEIEGLGTDIAKHIKGEKISHDFKKDYLSQEQAKELIASANSPRDKAIIFLAITCGLRTIEISRANIEDLTIKNGLSVLYVQGKGHKDKADYVQVPYQVEKTIRDYLLVRKNIEPLSPLFCSESDRDQGGRLTTRSISRLIKNAMKRVGLDSPRLTAHSLRHTCATLNLLNGGSLEETKQLLRHSSIQTTMIYNHSLDREKNKSEQRIANLLD